MSSRTQALEHQTPKDGSEIIKNSLLETKEKDVELDSLTEEQIKQRMTQQWKLHHGLFLDGHSIQPSKQAVFVDDGDLCTNLYRGEPMVYININGFDSLTNLLTFDNHIFSDLQPFDICINFPVAEITYKGKRCRCGRYNIRSE
ncbi:7401_t:CDS:2 [Rhizophagus irregularis]|nr:7401_t:CDS:2 [Rhizophagus irregularis]